MNKRNLDFVYQHNSRKDFPLVDDKLKTKRLLHKHGIAVPQTIANVSRIIEIDAVLKKISGIEQFVVKPSRGSGGTGILVLSGKSKQAWCSPGGSKITSNEIAEHMANILFGAYSGSSNIEDSAIVEEYVAQHNCLDNVYDGGVSDIRLLSVERTICMAMLRMPTVQSGGRANLHQGGLGVPIDIATGRLGVALHTKNYIKYHPDSNELITGMVLPYWKKIMETALAAAKAVPLGFLGIDIVLTDRGPLVLELNGRPGIQIQAVNNTPLGAVVDP